MRVTRLDTVKFVVWLPRYHKIWSLI